MNPSIQKAAVAVHSSSCNTSRKLRHCSVTKVPLITKLAMHTVFLSTVTLVRLIRRQCWAKDFIVKRKDQTDAGC